MFKRVAVLFLWYFGGVTSVGLANDVPLDGKVKQLWLGDWVVIDEEKGDTVESALAKCNVPLVDAEYAAYDAVQEQMAEVPGWEKATGDLSVFLHNGFYYRAAKAYVGYGASLYDHTRMFVEGTRAMIVGVHVWNHSLAAGFAKTITGEGLETVPLPMLMQNGIVETDQFCSKLASATARPWRLCSPSFRGKVR